MKSTIYLACLESMEMKAVGWYLDELLEYVIASNRCDELLRYLFSLIEISLGIVWRYLRMDERHEADGWEVGDCQQQ